MLTIAVALNRRKDTAASRLLAGLPLPGRPFRAENVLVPSGDVGCLCSVEGVY
jgi:hypothetical protein